MVGWARSAIHRPGAISDWVQVYLLYKVVRSIAIAESSVMDMSPDTFVLMFWDFYLSNVVESVVSRGCRRGEESGSLYLVDPIAIIEVRGEEVLAPTLDGGRLWRRGPGLPGGSELRRELWVGILLEISCCYSAA
jgi:hypothetical protein